MLSQLQRKNNSCNPCYIKRIASDLIKKVKKAGGSYTGIKMQSITRE
jgi:hypothetical protein